VRYLWRIDLEQAIFKTLASFGFNQVEIEVYIFLAKTGPLRAKDVASKFEIPNNGYIHA